MPNESVYDLSELIALCDLPRLLPRRGGKRIHLGTLHRWRLAGKLPCVRIGTHYYVRCETLDALLQPGNPPPVQTATARAQERAAEKSRAWAREYLAARGF